MAEDRQVIGGKTSVSTTVHRRAGLTMLQANKLHTLPAADKPLSLGGEIRHLTQEEFVSQFGLEYEEKVELENEYLNLAGFTESIYSPVYHKNDLKLSLSWSYASFSKFCAILLLKLEGRTFAEIEKYTFGQVFDRVPIKNK